MRCQSEYCREKIEGDDYEEFIKKGYFYCNSGHKNEVPGRTQDDYNCDCGARKVNHPAHVWWCTAYVEHKKWKK